MQQGHDHFQRQLAVDGPRWGWVIWQKYNITIIKDILMIYITVFWHRHSKVAVPHLKTAHKNDFIQDFTSCTALNLVKQH